MVLGLAAAAALRALQVLTEKRLRTNQQCQGRQIVRSLRLERIGNGPGLATQSDQCFNVKRLSHWYIVLEHFAVACRTSTGWHEELLISRMNTCSQSAVPDVSHHGIALPGIKCLNAGLSMLSGQQRGVWQHFAYKSSRGSGFFLVFDTCRNDVRLPSVWGFV
ncbi:hypothetical protein D3C85_1353110 [compost metagenome]